MAKIIKQATVNGHKVRVIETKAGAYQAQTKTRGDRYFDDYGPECETQDHAFYWAFESISEWFGDGASSFSPKLAG